MKVCGFTFVRNAVKFDYPVAESILSVLPVCDEFVVAAGNSDDGTRELISSLHPAKIRIIDTVWDDSLRKDGRVLALETDKAMAALPEDCTWAFYIQADEVVHESHLPAIRRAMELWKDDPEVEGLLFSYLHFFGSYDYVAVSRDWYRKEVRIIRRLPGISSYRDAQGFRREGRKLRVKPVDACIYHYGWVKSPASQQAKQESFHRHWHDDEWVRKNIVASEEFDYGTARGLKRFGGSHPLVMEARIKNRNWEFSPDPLRNRLPLSGRILGGLEDLTGWRIGEYKNYRLI